MDYLIFDTDINPKSVQTFIGWVTTKLQTGTKELYVALSTNGGNVNSGILMANFIRSIPCSVTMHNISSVGSIGIPVFCSAGTRYCSNMSTTVFHGSGMIKAERLDEATLQNLLEFVSNQNDVIARSISQTSGMDFEECRSLLSGEKSKPAQWALEHGICQKVCEFEIPAGVTPTTLF